MDGSIEISTILSVAAAVSVLGGAWLTIRKINREAKKEREFESAKILHLAKEADAKLQAAWVSKRELLYGELNNKIDEVKKDLENLRKEIEKDMNYMKTTHNSELHNLGEKIENLRTKLRDQHGELVKLLTTMIADRD